MTDTIKISRDELQRIAQGCSCEVTTDALDALLATPPADAADMGGQAGELWAVHAQGPDDIYPAFDRADAERHAAELNAIQTPPGISVGAVVIPSPMSPLEHWKELAEQEREHKAQVIARAAQPAPVVPEGYVLVPIKPTIEMVEAGYEEGIGKPDRSGHARVIEQYDAMLAAAGGRK